MSNEGKVRVSALNALIAEITLELLRAVDLHPIDNRTPLEWLAIIGEEYGEAQKAAVQTLFEPDKGATWRDHRTELVQTAATVLRAILALDTYTINAPRPQPAANLVPRKYRLFPDCVVCNNGEATKPGTLAELDTLCDRHRHTLKEWLDEHSAALPPKRRIIADYESAKCVVCAGKAAAPRTTLDLNDLCQEHYNNYSRYGNLA